jgi:hypothetical protein
MPRAGAVHLIRAGHHEGRGSTVKVLRTCLTGERTKGPRADSTVGSDAMSSTSPDFQPQRSDMVAVMVDYILSQHPSKYTAETLPHDQSLLELGILDSAGVIEFIVFVE